MTPKTRTIPEEEFEANCLALLDEVAETGGEIVVTKQGKPTVKVVAASPHLQAASLAGSVLWTADDIDKPIGITWHGDTEF